MTDRLIIFGKTVYLYSVFGFLASLLLISFNLFQIKKISACRTLRKRKKNGTARMVMYIIILSMVQYLSGVIMNNVIGNLLTDGSANFFGTAVIGPLFVVLSALIMGFDPLRYLDLVAPGYALELVSFKIGCFTAGCCAGMKSSYGVYNILEGDVCFPVQLVESAVALVIFLVLLRYRKKAGLGRMHPMFLILYSSTRFCSEFLRIEPNVAGPFKRYHFFCVAGCVIGLTWDQIMKRYAETIDCRLISLLPKKK